MITKALEQQGDHSRRISHSTPAEAIRNKAPGQERTQSTSVLERNRPGEDDPAVNRCHISPYCVGGNGDYHGPSDQPTRPSDEGEATDRRSTTEENPRRRPWRIVPSRNSAAVDDVEGLDWGPLHRETIPRPLLRPVTQADGRLDRRGPRR